MTLQGFQRQQRAMFIGSDGIYLSSSVGATSGHVQMPLLRS